MGTKPNQVRAGRTLSEDEEAVEYVGVRVEESGGKPRSGNEAQLDDPGFVDFAAAGSQVSGEFRCADCGYGAIVHSTLPQCPMCGGDVWERRGRQPSPFPD